MRIDPARINRDFFFHRIRKSDGCWEWTGFRDSRGYGRMNVARANGVGRASEGVHRVSWVLSNGVIPDGAHVLHGCDNPACVRPEHLRLGTHAENMKDAQERGRMRKPQGSESPASKLSKVQRSEALSRALCGEPYPAIAADYGVTPQCVYQIRKKWERDRAP